MGEQIDPVGSDQALHGPEAIGEPGRAHSLHTIGRRADDLDAGRGPDWAPGRTDWEAVKKRWVTKTGITGRTTKSA